MARIEDSTDPTVSIVVVAHSVRDELERCFEAIARHAHLPVELILVDNGSTDDTVAWVRAHHPTVEIVSLGRNIGWGAARNYGIERVKAPLTLLLDSDARLTAGALPAMVSALERNPGWGLVGPRLVYDDGSPQPSCRRFPPRSLPLLRRPPLARWLDDSEVVRRHLMADASFDRARPVLYMLGACQLYRSSLGLAAGRFDPRLSWGPDDADWCIRIRDAGGEVVHLPQATVVHSYRRITRQNPISMVALRHLAAFVHFQRKYRRRRRELIQLERELDEQSQPVQ